MIVTDRTRRAKGKTHGTRDSNVFIICGGKAGRLPVSSDSGAVAVNAQNTTGDCGSISRR